MDSWMFVTFRALRVLFRMDVRMFAQKKAKSRLVPRSHMPDVCPRYRVVGTQKCPMLPNANDHTRTPGDLAAN